MNTSLEYFKQRNKELAIASKVKYRLSEILPMLSKDRLTEIASSIGLPGRSKMNKAMLAAELPSYLLQEHRLSSILQLSDEKEFQFYQEVLRQPHVHNNDVTPGTYLHFMKDGIMFTFFEQGKLYFVIPEELKEIHQQLDWDALLRTRSREQGVLKYVKAAVNLYGICTPELVLSLYNDHNDQCLSVQDLKDITEFQLVQLQYYDWIEGYLVSQYFDEDNLEEFYDLQERIQNKPRYIPDIEEFLKYEDDFYHEKTPQLMQLRLFILNQLCDDAERVDDIIDDIQLACSMEEPLQMIVNELDRRNIVFDSMDQVKRFTSLVTEVYNHTRLWSNCGYTPAELSALSGGYANRLIPGQRVAPVKVGRNDPCPCGSGKKYKKCCGN